MSKHLSSRRAQARKAARRRRSESRELRRNLLDLVAAGHPYERIAETAKISVSALKRQVRRALAERSPEPAETFVALQRERLNKALQFTDLAMERGDLRAVSALVALLPHVERYWGLHTALGAGRGGGDGVHVLPPKPMKSLAIETELPPRECAPAPASS